MRCCDFPPGNFTVISLFPYLEYPTYIVVTTSRYGRLDCPHYDRSGDMSREALHTQHALAGSSYFGYDAVGDDVFRDPGGSSGAGKRGFKSLSGFRQKNGGGGMGFFWCMSIQVLSNVYFARAV